MSNVGSISSIKGPFITVSIDLFVKNSMEKIRINRARLTDLVWRTILEETSLHSLMVRDELLSKSSALDELRHHAAYNTGSISTGAIYSLFAAIAFFRPKIIAEVGTFIGKSTFAMACGLDICHSEGGQIFTCDFSNNIPLDFGTTTQVLQYPMTSSGEMFRDLLSKKIRCDIILLDGRLPPEDLPVLGKLLHHESVILLDDFEGIEKGVSNAALLMPSLQATHLLAYPPSFAMLKEHGLHEGCSVAMIVPRSLIEHTHQ